MEAIVDALEPLPPSDADDIVEEACFVAQFARVRNAQQARPAGAAAPDQRSTAENYWPRLGDWVLNPVPDDKLIALAHAGLHDQHFFHTERNAALQAFLTRYGHPPLQTIRSRARRFYGDPVLAITEQGIKEQELLEPLQEWLLARRIAQYGQAAPPKGPRRQAALVAADAACVAAIQALDVPAGTLVLVPPAVPAPPGPPPPPAYIVSTYALLHSGAQVVEQLRALKRETRVKAEEAVASAKRKASALEKANAKRARREEAAAANDGLRSPPSSHQRSARPGLRNSPPVPPTIADLARQAVTGVEYRSPQPTAAPESPQY